MILKRITGLLIIAVIGGSILIWLIFPVPHIICLPYYLKLLTLFVCITGGIIGYLISNVSLYYYNKSLEVYNIRVFCGSIWFIPYISTYGVIYWPLSLGVYTVKRFDQGWSEFIGSQILYYSLKNISKFNQLVQNNNLKIYLLTFII